MKGFDDNMKLVKYKIKDIEGKAGVYKITCISNGRFYIGSSKNLWKRHNEHNYLLNNNKHCNKELQADYNTYGIDNFKFEIIEFCTKENHFDREQVYLDMYKDKDKFYNKSTSAYNNNYVSEETKKKISKIHKGKKLSEEHKKHISEAFKGEKHPNYGKRGKLSPNYGKHHSEETKKKMSENHPSGGNHPLSRCVYVYNKDYNLINKFDALADCARYLLDNKIVVSKSKNPIETVTQMIIRRIKNGKDLNGLYFSYEPIEDKKVS